MKSEKLLFLDCQTTGMHPSLGQILEIAWCIASADEAEPVIHSYLIELGAEAYLPKRVQEITGIKAHDMVSAIPETLAREKFLESLSSSSKLTAMIHYAQFEKPFLHGFLFGTDSTAVLPFEVLCTHALSKRLLPNVPSRNIRALSGFFGAHLPEVKRSTQHVQATLEIWKGLISEFEKLGLQTVAEIQEWSKTAPKQKSERYQYKIEREKRLKLPDRPGVYRMIAKNGEILYVGKATSLKDRVNSYFRGKRGRDPRKLEMMAQAWDLEVTECGSALEAALLETDEIKRFEPPYNVSLKGAKRKLLFYSPDFGDASESQDEAHKVGPFRTYNPIEDLKLLDRWQRTGRSEGLFYNLIPEDLLPEGYRLFKEKWGLTTEPSSVRSRLALALKLKKEIRKRAVDSTETELGVDLDTTETREDELKAHSVLSDVVITPEEVAEKFERLHLRAGTAYERAKMLTRLLNSRVRWQENQSWRELVICRGQVNQSLETPLQSGNDSALPKSWMPWESMSIADYDRMSVLFSELSARDHEIRFLEFS